MLLTLFLCCVCFGWKLWLHVLFSLFKEQPSSAVNLRFVLEWTWNKVICTKDELDQICEYWCSNF